MPQQATYLLGHCPVGVHHPDRRHIEVAVRPRSYLAANPDDLNLGTVYQGRGVLPLKQEILGEKILKKLPCYRQRLHTVTNPSTLSVLIPPFRQSGWECGPLNWPRHIHPDQIRSTNRRHADTPAPPCSSKPRR